MAALVSACQSGLVPAQIALVVSPVEGSPAVDRARSFGLEVSVLAPKDAEYAGKLLDILNSTQVEWICLAGLMTKLPPLVIEAFAGRTLNIHPSLLPKFGGKGMYGKHVHEAVLAAGESESGCTVHIVTDVYDEGQILLQERCTVLPGDKAELLAARVLELELVAYPRALKMVIEQNATVA